MEGSNVAGIVDFIKAHWLIIVAAIVAFLALRHFVG